MEHKAICVAVLALSLVLGTLAQGPVETCDVAPTERKNCGFPGITNAECAARGCCFNSATRGVPWCFSPAPADGGDDGEEDCGF